MAEKRKLIIDVFGKEYEIAGGDGSMIPGDNTVDSQKVVDGSLGRVDMDDDVNDGLDELNNISITDQELEEIFTGNSEAGSDEGEASGDGPSLDDL